MQKPLDAFASILADLIDTGSIPASRLSSAARMRIQQLFDGDVIVEERSGAGRAIRVVRPDTLKAFANRQYPAGLMGEESVETSRRGAALETFRDSKATPGLGFEFLTFRLLAGALRIGEDDVTVKNLRRGFGSEVLHDNRVEYPWPSYQGLVATVENPTVFLHFPWASCGVGLAVLTSGKGSTRLFNWLASDPMSAVEVVHFGDYDPVGLSEYIRLKSRLGERLRMYVPDDVTELFKAYGNPELVTKSSNLLPKLSKTDDPEVRRMIRLMQEYGGLEQEVLIIKA